MIGQYLQFRPPKELKAFWRGFSIAQGQTKNIENMYRTYSLPTHAITALKVHKNENFFGSDFEFFTILLLVMLKY